MFFFPPKKTSGPVTTHKMLLVDASATTSSGCNSDGVTTKTSVVEVTRLGDSNTQHILHDFIAKFCCGILWNDLLGFNNWALPCITNGQDKGIHICLFCIRLGFITMVREFRQSVLWNCSICHGLGKCVPCLTALSRDSLSLLFCSPHVSLNVSELSSSSSSVSWWMMQLWVRCIHSSKSSTS